MYTDLERSHVSCDVSYLLGPVSLVMLFRQHSEGECGFLICYCVFMEIHNVCKPNWIFYLIKCRYGLLHQMEPLKRLILIMKNMCAIYILTNYRNCTHLVTSFSPMEGLAYL